jgi:hypothetical protein
MGKRVSRDTPGSSRIRILHAEGVTEGAKVSGLLARPLLKSHDAPHLEVQIALAVDSSQAAYFTEHS